jgi:hypothetical protein
MSNVSAFMIIFGLALSSATKVFADSRFSFQPQKPWQKAEIAQVLAGWMIKNLPSKPSITITADVGDSTFDFSDLNEDNIIGFVEAVRAIPMRIFGITDFKVEKHHIQAINEGNLIEMQGHYRATSGYLVRFIERDYFVGKTCYTISFFEDETGSPLQKDADIEKVLDLFKLSDEAAK